MARIQNDQGETQPAAQAPTVPGIEFTCKHGEAEKGHTRVIVPNGRMFDLDPRRELTEHVAAKLVGAEVAKFAQVPVSA